MEEAKIVLIEDSPDVRAFVHRWLQNTAHDITQEADSLNDALKAIDAIANGELAGNVLILDGNLGFSHDDNEDARAVIARVRERELGVKIIGLASIPLPLSGIMVDANCKKSTLSDLPHIIDAL